jgi:cell division septum initiation protein DivIVA
MNLYAGSPINNKFNKKKNSMTINNFGRTPKKFFRIKKDKEFNQLLDDYYENYYKFQKKNKHFKKPIKEEENFNFNQFQLKRKI